MVLLPRRGTPALDRPRQDWRSRCENAERTRERLLMLRIIWTYRAFILGSIRREFQARHRNSILGSLWMVLNPLFQITVYTVIFSEVMRSRLDGAPGRYAFSIYLCAGVITWGLFADIVTRTTTVFVDNAAILKKLNFPRICLPVIVVGGSLLNFVIMLALFLVFLVVTGNFPGWAVLGLIPVVLVQCAFAAGLGIGLGVINVFFRDVTQFVSILLQFWFWLTPIVYARSILPETVQSSLRWNPMAAVMAVYQDAFLQDRWPQWQALWPTALMALLLCLLAMRLFRRRVGEMVDEL